MEVTSGMQTQTIQRQSDEVIAAHYDDDPQSTTRNSLDRAVAQIHHQGVFADATACFKALDLGMGTGMFLESLLALAPGRIEPFGLDLSARMIDCASRKLPGLTSAVDDAANFDAHFSGHLFDLISTHFITGFVPMNVLAPKIHSRLEEGGYWSLVGGTKAAWPNLQRKANSWFLQKVCGGRSVNVDDLVCNPADRAEVVQSLEEHGFVVRDAETFRPNLHFADFDEFMTFAYYGGWLTPFVESLNLHRLSPRLKWLLNRFYFPTDDTHSIEVILAQKIED